MEESETQPLLDMRGIRKKYEVNQVLANDGVDLRVYPGEIHGLVGENGAGKTTLMKILDGLEKADSGEIFLKGKPVSPRSPHDALRLGIGMVHQHFRLIPELTVAENVILGREPRRVFHDLSSASEAIRSLATEYGFTLNPGSRVRDLSLSEMQQVEIVKVLFRRVDLIILDEPTAGLAEAQISILFEGLRSLVKRGKTIILITHKLKEVLAVTDRVTVLRRGRTVASSITRLLTEEKLGSLAFAGYASTIRHPKADSRQEPGRPPANRPSGNRSEIIYELRGVCLSEGSRLVLDSISFRIHVGEILAVVGVSGNGLAELEDVVCGLKRPTTGAVLHRGEDVTRCDPRKLRKRGMALVPSNRLFKGVSLEATIMDNLIVNRRPDLDRWGVLFRKRIKEFSRKLLDNFTVMAALDLPAGYLSGGNIQKVILARELAAGKDFFLFSEAAWGIDASSIAFVHGEILNLRARGNAILLISTDLDEALALADRIVVMHRGKLIAAFTGGERSSKQSIGLAMLGSVRENSARC